MMWLWYTSFLLPLFSTMCAVLLLFLISKSKNTTTRSKLLPPGPPGWPIIGNMLDLGQLPHQKLYNLGSKFGPVIYLKIGSINTIVVQSEKAASKLFKKCDLPFADRKVPDSLTAFDYNQSSVAIGAHASYWRRIRRICTTEFLVHKRLNATVSVRRKGVDHLIDWIKKESEISRKSGGRGEICIDRILFMSNFNVIGNLMLSRDVMESALENVNEFFDAFVPFMEWMGKPNVADFFPFLKWVDPQGIRRSTEKYLSRLLKIGSGIVKDRIRERQSRVVKDTYDFLDKLMEDEGDINDDGHGKLSEKNITIVLLEMFFGGTETASNTIEWGMTELLRHPHAMQKLCEEIDQVIGQTRKVEESDLNNLPYLQATVKEIFRLHTPVPMLLPRNATQDTEFMGYLVPKDTQIFVNAWAIHRDPETWPDPLTFKPERFLGSDIDYKGQHYELLPFGSGRRSCLGMTLGHRMVSFVLASLVQSFDWKLGDGIKAEEVDMTEKSGMTLRKLVPLKVIPTARN